MKKLFDTMVLLLAVNFLALAGGVGWLAKSGHLDKPRIDAIKEVLFPKPAVETPATRPAGPEAPPPASQRLQELLARHSIGRTAADQSEFVQQTFDVAMAQLDRREREVADREQQVARTNDRLANDRKTLDGDREKLIEQGKEADKLKSDQGFQDTLNLYNTMPGKQVKGVFMAMDDSSAADYLDAMQPRTAAKILKEFKSPAELDRMKRILDKMRHPPATQPSKEPL